MTAKDLNKPMTPREFITALVPQLTDKDWQTIREKGELSIANGKAEIPNLGQGKEATTAFTPEWLQLQVIADPVKIAIGLMYGEGEKARALHIEADYYGEELDGFLPGEVRLKEINYLESEGDRLDNFTDYVNEENYTPDRPNILTRLAHRVFRYKPEPPVSVTGNHLDAARELFSKGYGLLKSGEHKIDAGLIEKFADNKGFQAEPAPAAAAKTVVPGKTA